MAGLNLLSENYLDSATLSITTGAANAQFPLSNLQNPSTAKKFRSVGNTVVVVLDLVQTRDIDTIALVGDQTYQLGVTSVSVKTSVTNDFTLSTAIPITISSDHNIGYEFITQVTHRFVEVTMTGTGSYAELGRLYVGKRTTITQNSLSIGSFKYSYQDRTRVSSNRYGQKFIDELPLQKAIGGRIEFATKDEQEIIDDLYIRHGIHEPIWVIVDPNSDGMNEGQFKLAMYSYFESQPSWSASGGQTYSTEMNFKQVV